MMRTAIRALLASTAMTLAAAPIVAAQDSGRVRGRVVDASTGAPLEAALAMLDSGRLASRTGADGTWRLGGVSAGRHTLHVRRIGYVAATIHLTLAAGADTSIVIALAPSTRALDAMVVTASRRAERLKDVVVTTMLVSRSDIDDTGSSDVASVLREQTGIQFTGGHPSGSGVALQGLGDQRVLVLIDGLPLHGRISGGLDLTRIPTSIVERIEVVKGPQSTLYGSEAMGGVVNILTRGAAPQSTDAQLRATVGSDRRIDTDLYASTRQGALTATGAFGHRYMERTPGIPSTAGALTDRVDGMATVQWAPASALALDANALVLNERQRWPSAELYDFADNTQANARLGATWTTEARRVTSHVYVSQLDHLSRSSQFTSPIRGTGDRQTQRLAQAEALYSQRVAGMTVDAGAQVRQEYISSTDGRIAGGSRTLASAEPFAQAEWATGGLRIVPGARLSWNEQWGTYLSPRVAMRYRGDSPLTWRASIGRGFRAPDFKELYLDFTNDAALYAVRGNANLRPEHSDNASLGLEWDGGRVYGSAQAYWNELHDFIETRPLPNAGGFAQYTYGNVDRATTRGVELESGARLGALRLEGGYAYLYARDRGDGGPLLGQAARSGRLLLGGPLLGARVTATGVYTGRTPMERADDGRIIGTRDPYARLDLRATRRVLPRAELSLGVDNVFDTTPARWADATARQFYLGVSVRARRAPGAR